MLTGSEKPYSPEIPWVLCEVTRYGIETWCEVCDTSAVHVDQTDVHGFAYAHAEHTSGEGYLGVGDAVAAVAKPIARAFGKAPCTPCEARRRQLNQARVRWPWGT